MLFWKKFEREDLNMAEVSKKIGQAALYFLLLAGPVLGVAAKGFAPLLAISGSAAFVAVLMRPEQLKQIDLSKFIYALPFLLFTGFSLIWSQAEKGVSSYFIFILVIIFTACLRIIFKGLTTDEQDNFKHLLSASLLFGIIAAVFIGSYPLFWPELSILTDEVSNQLTFANIELLRQSNRSLSLTPVFLFPLAGFYWHRARWLSITLVTIIFFVTANSNSQTAFLAMLLGIIVFVFAYFYRYDGRKLIFAVTAIGLLFSPPIFMKIFENDLVEKYAPQIVKQKAAGEIREWIYYTYAKEALSQPFIGHGLRSTTNFSPDNPSNYKTLAHERNIPYALVHAHNLPLQIIFEFGYLGAVTFLAAFWWLINLGFDNSRLPFPVASLSAVCGLLIFSYSLWQSWLLASLGFLYFYVSILYLRED